MPAELFVVMPVYNEAEAVAGVVSEWLPALRAAAPSFALLCVDDGSTDATPEILARLARDHAEVSRVRQANAGHGAACLAGYRAALASGAPWILQIDSDGQCDPRDFPGLWAARETADAVFGLRRRRGDGRAREGISRVLRLVARGVTGVAVPDANVPYRLMRRSALAECLPDVPPGFELANVALAVLLVRRGRVGWREIDFRARSGGRSSLRPRRLAAQGWRLLGDLRRLRAALG